ncbi:MAG TPA: peptidoglycan DD-metalloendopeptidase family protein [Steroidobacteraceae bacterium]|nr:peptidoglycan DD-metalloendopeptidase family protein [Steroidobacteraceae bacterium]
MKRSIKYWCLSAAISFGVGAIAAESPGRPASAAGQPQGSVQADAKLAEIRGRIASLTNRLHDELQERDSQGARLREAEVRIAAARRRLENLRGAEIAAERRGGELRAAETQARAALDSERAALAAQVRTAYMLGTQEPIKLLLNQSDAAAAGRMAALYVYFVRARVQKIDEIGARVARVQDLVDQIQQSTERLQALRNDAGREMADLQHARDERAAALAAVTKQVSSGSEELARLRREEQAEEALVADLARMLQDVPVDRQASFEELRGRLPWPVHGRIAARYQDSRAAGAPGLRWNGVLIEAARGAKVRAPYFGRVVYADWLQGLGLLLIIGHTGNYMTLYGRAEVLYKSVGDWVAPGDVIAALGDGANVAPQLYFEIRAGRSPKDPKIWLKKMSP